MTQPDNAAEVREQLKVVLAVITDARHEMASDPRSLVHIHGFAELHEHFLAVWKSVEELQGIIERRLRGHDEASDASKWAELAEKVVLREKQVRELRGKFGGGQKLARWLTGECSFMGG